MNRFFQRAVRMRFRTNRALPTPTLEAFRLYSAGPEVLGLQQIESRVLQLLKDFDKVKAEKLTLDSHFVQDLGLDSLDQVEITMALEDEFNIEISDKDAEEIYTPRQAVEKHFASLLGFRQQKYSMEGQKDKFKQRMLAAPVIKKVNIVKTEKSEKELPDRPKLEKPIQYQSQNVSVGRMLMEIIQLLKVDAKPMTAQEIFNKTLFDISQSPKLLDALNTNERITRDGDTYQFKPRYQVRTKEQLVELLKQNRGVGGMEVKELKQSYDGVTGLIDELEKTQSILVIRLPKDKTPRTVYYNDTTANVAISPEFIDLWHNTNIPSSAIDLKKEMRAVGLELMKVDSPKETQKKRGEKKIKRKSRFKVTNTHLRDVGNLYVELLDLSKDMPNPT